ncbi:helix-turn-helix domain-containing protein [Nocardia sp. IBHARD005]|uniref:helix-turn-helix domain-containing protein n=1 Tax=Nocardia sp. IBHARD005 TaxID=3457765 RepID=UPI004059D553
MRSRQSSDSLQPRIDHARLLMESTDDTVDRVARDTGFGSTVSLRHHFHRMLGRPETAHRARFRVTAQ